MTEFFNMGGYGFFIWTSYATVGLLLTYHYFAPMLRHKTILKSLINQPRSKSSIKIQDAP